MAKSLRIDPNANESKELPAEMDQILAEIDRLRAKMKRDDQEIERSRTRTEAILRDLATILPPR